MERVRPSRWTLGAAILPIIGGSLLMGVAAHGEEEEKFELLLKKAESAQIAGNLREAAIQYEKALEAGAPAPIGIRLAKIYVNLKHGEKAVRVLARVMPLLDKAQAKDAQAVITEAKRSGGQTETLKSRRKAQASQDPPVIPRPAAPDPAVSHRPVGSSPQDIHTDKSMVFIEGGKNLQGTTVSSFYLDTTEVTVADFKRCVDAGKCEKPDGTVNGEQQFLDKCNWKKRESHPVNCITWYQAEQFCRWRERRLPTGDEWTFAAKMAKQNRICTNNLGIEVSSRNTCLIPSLSELQTHETVWDMDDNVAEWTGENEESDKARLFGGSWYSGANYGSYLQVKTWHQADLGVRCARSAPLSR